MGLLMAFTLAAGAAAEYNNEVEEGVVVVGGIIEFSDKRVIYQGTGFFVGKEGEDPQYIVTNYHEMVDAFLATGGGKDASRLYVFYSDGMEDNEEAYLVCYDDKKDIAVLKLDSPTSQRKPLKLEIPTNSDKGSDVWAVGYPSVVEETAGSVTSYRKEDAIVTGGSISSVYTESGTGRKLIATDTTIHEGNSGGPLVNARGNAVGITSYSGLSDGEVVDNVNYAISIEEVTPLLDRYSVPYELYDKASADSGNSGEASDGSEDSGNSGDSGNSEDIKENIDDPEKFPWMIVLIILGVVVVALVVVLAVVLARSKHPRKPDNDDGGIVPPPPQRGAYLRSLSPQHGGMQVPVGSQPVLIGRDIGSCALVFQNGTPGVSSHHCSVAWDAASGQFLLTDMRSTYGTFLSNGQKVTPGVAVPLQPGSTFYLGERANAIRVELG